MTQGYLFRAVAQLAGRAGFMSFDVLAHQDARRAFDLALACAEESGDWHWRARVLHMMAQHSHWCGRSDESLTYAEMALVRGDRLTASEQAMLHATRARALARLGRTPETLAAVGAADAAFAHADAANDPSTVAHYTLAQHHGVTGRALADLALAGGRVDATTRLSYAVRHEADEYTRSRTLFQIRLAATMMAVGDLHEAAAIGHAAVDALDGLRSRRALDELRELDRYAGRHPRVAEAIELRERIAAAA
jgi:hypothetical protein